MSDKETQDILAQIELLYQSNSATSTANKRSSASITNTRTAGSHAPQQSITTVTDEGDRNPQIVKKRVLNLPRSNRPTSSGDILRSGAVFNNFVRPLLDENTNNAHLPELGSKLSPSISPTPNINTTTNSSSSSQSVQTPTVVRNVVPSAPNTILVSRRQKGNPVLQHIRGAAWEYGDIIPDYVTGTTSCVLFLSLKYHLIHPEYIHNRMSKLGSHFTLRTLLMVVDIENHTEPIKELTKVCVIRGYTMILAWSASEAGDYISKFKLLENIAPAGIQGYVKEDYSIRITEVLNSVRGVNKNDAVSLISTFGSFKDAVLDAGDSVEAIGGWGETKARRFKAAVTEPFIYNKKYKKVHRENSNIEEPRMNFDII